MKINKLKLRGAIGIKKGLGIEEIEVDFTKFQTGLVALTGKNGSGKTTIMENLHPFRTMVSRDGSLQNHFYLKDSYRVLEFEYEGLKYEAKILIDALTGGSEAYLLQDGKPLNDGKLTTYDEEIEKVLGSQDLFFNSVFSGQKSKGIAELKPADRRKLFYELLNLNIYDGYLEKAKAELKKEELKLSTIEGQLSSIQSSLIPEETLQSDLYHAQTNLSDVFMLEKAQLEKDIQSVQAQIKNLELDYRSAEDKKKFQAELNQKLTRLENSVSELTKQHNAKTTRYNSEIKDYEDLITRSQKLLEDSENIDFMLEETSRLKTEIDSARNKVTVLLDKKNACIEDISKDKERLNNIKNELSSISYNRNAINEKLKQFDEHISREENNERLIGTVPCDDKTGLSCQFLINAYSAKTNLPKIREKKSDLLSELNGLNKQFSLIENNHNEEQNKIQKKIDIVLDQLNEDIELISNELKNKQDLSDGLNKNDWAAMKEDSKKAENDIRLYEEKIEGLKKIKSETLAHFEKELMNLSQEINEVSCKIDEKIDLELARILSEKASKKNQLNDKINELNRCNSGIEKTLQEISAIEERINQQSKLQSKKASLEIEKQASENQITEWVFLTKAFDKTGIPVLKLENSGVEITSVANELLSMFDNKFRIVFETTSLTKDKKKLKETFDINIVDEEGACEISNKSGGQQVWIETAIQSAISLVVRQQGRNIKTSFLDEKDGALDLDNALNYIQMLKKAHEMSGVHNTFIITHRTELLDLIPQQVKLSDGFLQILN